MTTLNRNAIDIRPYRRAKKFIVIGNAIGQLLVKLNEMRLRRSAIRQLEALTDAQLEDIGVPRYDIRRVVNSKMSRRQNKVAATISHAPRESSANHVGQANAESKLAA